MTPKNSNNEQIIAEFIRNLDTTTELLQGLLKDIREGEINFAAISTELHILVNNVKELSSSIKETDDGLGDLKTRIALLEKSVLEIEAWIKSKHVEEHAATIPITVANTAGKWQVTAAIIAGSLAFITAAVTLAINLLAK